MARGIILFAMSANGSDLRIVALLCAAEVLSMTGFSTYPALLEPLREAWGLSGTEAGFIGGVFFGGYMIAVPLLSGLTDRIDARRVYAGACLLSALGTAGFGLLAQDVWSAGLCQALAGAGLAGTYMPGLKALTDRVEGPLQSRFIAFYTSSFGIGASASLLAGGWLAGHLGWEWTFILCGAGPLAAAVLALRGLRPAAAHPLPQAKGPLIDLRLLTSSRATLGYVLGYAAHSWELFGLRAWMVAFIAFAYTQSPEGTPLWAPATAAAAINLLGIPASIFGNEVAGRIGRRRAIAGVMGASAALAGLAGFLGPLAAGLALALVALHFVFVMADSAALTAGLVAAAPPGKRGATLAVYSFFGFGGGFLGPLAFGWVFDLAGGGRLAWGLAYASLGAACACGPLTYWLTARKDGT
ncbi:MAG: MFS transporter [Burkholderiales bacterium]|nr:MFS transporter [Burkholderiales bacterium]GIK45804.1 MAG: MFS transporter [Betaproteobacteria bacterium]GJQ53499.1 MAG: MFS transporter [Rhodocyclaceae bacterium]